MRRDVLIAAFNRIIRDLSSVGLAKMIDEGFEKARREKGDSSWVNLEIFARLSVEYATYNEAERKLLEIFDLSDLYSFQFWGSLTTSPDPGTLLAKRNDLRFALGSGPIDVSVAI